MHCITDHMTISIFLVERNVISENPPYQRQGAIWSVEKRQLFVDSIFNGFDVPKIYLHDLRGHDPLIKYAIIDGKQRLDAIWGFLSSSYPLADDFVAAEPQGRPAIKGGTHFKDLHPDWQDIFKGKALDVVLVQNADEEDVEDLFSRLNNGEPLNAAEKRNAMGGRMCTLIREVAAKPFFQILPLATPDISTLNWQQSWFSWRTRNQRRVPSSPTSRRGISTSWLLRTERCQMQVLRD